MWLVCGCTKAEHGAGRINDVIQHLFLTLLKFSVVIGLWVMLTLSFDRTEPQSVCHCVISVSILAFSYVRRLSKFYQVSFNEVLNMFLRQDNEDTQVFSQ